jgi:hypothetical protein
LARRFRQSQRFSGLVAALKLAKHGDVLMAMLLTASSGKELKAAPEIEFFSADVDRETSVRWGWIGSISMT